MAKIEMSLKIDPQSISLIRHRIGGLWEILTSSDFGFSTIPKSIFISFYMSGKQAEGQPDGKQFVAYKHLLM